jgi:ABC-2 type transport system ATP-binding protein
VLRRFGEPAAASANGVAVRMPEGAGELAEIVRALDSEGVRVADLRLHTPSLDDVFLAKTGRSLEGAGDEQDDEGTTGEQPAVDGDGAPARPSAGAPAGRS